MRNIIKNLSVFFISVYCFLSVSSASKIYEYYVNSTARDIDTDNIKTQIFGLLTIIGYAIAIVVVLVTAIQFITANSQKRALLKEKLWLIILGVLVLAGGIPILTLVSSLFGNWGTELKAIL